MHPELEIQKFLRTHPLEELETQYAIFSNRHRQFPHLVMLKYNQIASPMHERLVQECRGIILDAADNWAIISRPYDKFFNHGEPLAAAVDWTTARVYEKLDGSLMTLYWYAGAWRISSSGMPDAAGSLPSGAGSFHELFWQTWHALGYKLPDDTTRCYMFELLTPHNRVVVRQERHRIVLHGARSLITGQELHPHDLADSGWEIVQSHALDSIASCLAAAALPAMESEGYVVCDRAFRRVKIKSPQYVALAHAKEGFSRRAIIELLRKSETAEFLAYFPELRVELDAVRAEFEALLEEIRHAYTAIAGISLQKDFAAAALRFRFSAALSPCARARPPRPKPSWLKPRCRLSSACSTSPPGPPLDGVPVPETMPRCHPSNITAAGVPVVLIQGVGVHGDGWLPQVEFLAAHGCRCLTFDNRGMGKSQPHAGALTVEQMADDTLALMDAAGMVEAHLVGHSLGGLMAIHLALTQRVRVKSLTLMCTFANGATALKLTPRMFWLGMRSRIGTRAMRRQAFLQIVMPAVYLKTVDRTALAEKLAVYFGHDLGDHPPLVDAQLKALKAYNATPRLKELAGVPTVIMSAAHDPIARPKDAGQVLAEKIPGSRYLEYADASHGLPLQFPERVNGLLLEHFQSKQDIRKPTATI